MRLKSPTTAETDSRRRFFGRLIAATGGVAGPMALTSNAGAMFGPGSVPTGFTLTLNKYLFTLRERIYVRGALWRLDGSTAGLSSAEVHFWVGGASAPTTDLGRRYTDNRGVVSIDFPANLMRVKGSYVLIADVKPAPCGDGWIAAPRPFVRFTVSK